MYAELDFYRAVSFVTNRLRNTFSVGDMLQHLNWCNRENRRKDTQLVMMNKIANENVVITRKDRLKPSLPQSWHIHSSSSFIILT